MMEENGGDGFLASRVLVRSPIPAEERARTGTSVTAEGDSEHPGVAAHYESLQYQPVDNVLYQRESRSPAFQVPPPASLLLSL